MSVTFQVVHALYDTFKRAQDVCKLFNYLSFAIKDRYFLCLSQPFVRIPSTGAKNYLNISTKD